MHRVRGNKSTQMCDQGVLVAVICSWQLRNGLHRCRIVLQGNFAKAARYVLGVLVLTCNEA